MSDQRQFLQTLREEVAKSGYHMEVVENEISLKSMEEKRNMLGFVPGPGEHSLKEREKLAAENMPLHATGGIGAPASFDWRNYNGQNYLGPIKDQSSCGSCVSFGTCATVEGTFRVFRGNPNLVVDFSEAHLFYCNNRQCNNGDPNAGWWPEPALDFFKNTGVTDEACYPYSAHNQACGVCQDWQGRVTKISGWHKITNPADMKTWISTRGPLSACFTVYNDFYAVGNTVYRHLTGAAVGGHCVCIVGYDDVAQCWIARNSWGPTFANAGYFRIAYGQCGIDAAMYAVDGIVETMWINNVRVQGLWSNESDRNAYVYLESIGWRKIANGNDNMHLNMLTQMATAKAANKTVTVHLNASIIDQMYVN